MLKASKCSLLERVFDLSVHVNQNKDREGLSHFEKVLSYFEMEQRETKKVWNAIVIELLWD